MNRIKELRKSKNLTQKDLAVTFSTTDSNVSGWESGKWQPDINTLFSLADYFDVSIDYLLGRETQKSPATFDGYGAIDKQTTDILKLFRYMNDIQRAQVYGYSVGLLEQAGVNVKAVLGY